MSAVGESGHRIRGASVGQATETRLAHLQRDDCPAFDSERSLEAMWHAYHESAFAAQNRVGGLNNSFILRPVSVERQTGLNVFAGSTQPPSSNPAKPRKSNA